LENREIWQHQATASSYVFGFTPYANKLFFTNWWGYWLY